MKKIMRFLTALGAASFVLGLMISMVEKKKKRAGSQEKAENGHQFYGPYEKYFKRPIDFAMALMALILLFPVMAVTGILVRMKLGMPVIFSQERPGKDERIFRLYKFRSMTEENFFQMKRGLRILGRNCGAVRWMNCRNLLIY